MSVALVIEKINGEKTDGYVPVSTQDSFIKYWLPICEKHDLPYLAQSETGYGYDQSHLPTLINEIEIFCRVLSNEQMPADAFEYLKTRSALLLKELRKLEGKEVEFFLG